MWGAGIILIMFVVLEVAAPNYIRLTGLSEFPSQPGDVESFQQEINRYRWRRVASAACAVIAIAAINVQPLRGAAILVTFGAFAAFWLFMVFDILRARRTWKLVQTQPADR